MTNDEPSVPSAGTPRPADGTVTEDTPDDRPQGRGISVGFGRYVLYRVTGSAVSLVMVVFSAFFIFRILPGDPIDSLMADIPATPEMRQALRDQWGLNDPLLVQFWNYLTGVFTGDLGTSFQYQRPVTELMADRLGPTVLLSGTALALSVVLGFLLGSLAAWKHGTRFDRVSVSTALVLYAAPTFWFGMIVIIIFARELRLFPVSGMVSPNTASGFWSQLVDVGHHLVLPTLTMTAMIFASYLLIMRASMLDEMGNDYLITARAKGLRDHLVRRRHGVRNALLPTTTLVFMGIGSVISGALFTEMLFSWPGLGYMTYEAISIPDYELLQGTFVVFSAATVLANLAADILYWFIDPRARKT